MTQLYLGGRGKKAPYKTLLSRIPESTQPVVEQLSLAFKQVAGDSYLEEKLLNKVQAAIISAFFEEDDTLKRIASLVEEKQAQKKNTRNWVEAIKLLEELQDILNKNNQDQVQGIE